MRAFDLAQSGGKGQLSLGSNRPRSPPPSQGPPTRHGRVDTVFWGRGLRGVGLCCQLRRGQPRRNSMTFTKGTVGTNKSHKPHSAQGRLAPGSFRLCSTQHLQWGRWGLCSGPREGMCHAGQIEGAKPVENSKGHRVRTRGQGSAQRPGTINLWPGSL